MLSLGVLAAGATVFACGCGEQYRTYEYSYCGNDRHEVAFSCSYIYCDDPFTICGIEPCPYEYDDEGNGECLYCGHIKLAE